MNDSFLVLIINIEETHLIAEKRQLDGFLDETLLSLAVSDLNMLVRQSVETYLALVLVLDLFNSLNFLLAHFLIICLIIPAIK